MCHYSMTAIEPLRRTRSRDRSQRLAPSGRPSLKRLLDRTGERKESRHFAGEVNRLAALLEEARVPFDAIGQFADSALVGIRPILKLTKLENRGSDLIRKFPSMATAIATDPRVICRPREQSCASVDDRERDPIDLAVKRKSGRARPRGCWIELAHIIEQETYFPHAPQRIERG